MAATKELRNRIRSVKNTAKITKAMELVSAAKMRRAQEQALRGRPYSNLINNVLRRMVTKIDPSAHPLLVGKEEGRQAALLVTTNRGLCGALNTNLFRKALELPNDVSFITVGKKGQLFVSKIARPISADFELSEQPSLESARTIAKHLTDTFLAGEFSRINVIYSDFYSTLKQLPAVKTILPIVNLEILNQLASEEERTRAFAKEYLFEPNPDQVLETILPHYIQMEIYQILLEAAASEHSARMVAMKNASDNANELVEDLILIYNQFRQEAITNELLDIKTATITLE